MAETVAISLKPEPLTRERFAPFGDVIEASLDSATAMNEARFQRFDDLCNIDMGGGSSVHEHDDQLERVQRAMAPYRNVVLLLPCEDREAALAYAREGASVLVADFNDETGAETARLIESAGGQAGFVQ